MIRFGFNCTKENFLWIPFLWITIFNIVYLILAILTMVMISMEGSAPDAGLTSTGSIFKGLVLGGYGIFVVPILNAIGLVTGILFAFIKQKPLSSSLKKKIVYFLICFYLAVGFSLFYLMSLPPNPIRP